MLKTISLLDAGTVARDPLDAFASTMRQYRAHCHQAGNAQTSDTAALQ
jgi:hypothetical protein